MYNKKNFFTMSEYFNSLATRRLRRVCSKLNIFSSNNISTSTIEYDNTWANLTGENFQMYSIKKIQSGQPFMVTRFGSGVLGTAIDYRLQLSTKTFLKYIFGAIDSLDLQRHNIYNLCNYDGFYPPNHDEIMRYGCLIYNTLTEIDAFATIMKQERFFANELSNKVRCKFRDLEPFHHDTPWTSVLEGKKVLVIHPFVNTIEYQYKYNREKIFQNKKCLPEFDLKLLRAVQNITISNDPYDQYNTWFDAYNFMCSKIDNIEFDIAILGCGAYGMPLAAYIKRMGKQSIHIGGSLQYLFGIRSKRAEEENPEVASFYNDAWVRPFDEDRPDGYKKIEDGCYW